MKYDYENNILKAVQSVGIDVDKERLAKALIDSRSFYDEGYADAKAKYENALDKACWLLEENFCCPLEAFDEEMKHCDSFNCDKVKPKDCWKEWCLDENRQRNV